MIFYDNGDFDKFYDYSLSQIQKIKNSEVKLELLKLYRETVVGLQNEFVSENLISNDNDWSINELLEIHNNFIYQNTSAAILPGECVKLYLGLYEYRASREIVCDFTGAIIKKGSYYNYYHPLIYSFSSKVSYALKRPWKVENGLQHLLPANIAELDSVYLKLINSYDNPLDEEIDWYDASRRIGDVVSLRNIHKKK